VRVCTNRPPADMLPLKHGIYVPVGSACKGASNAEMVNYWGGKNSIGVSQVWTTTKIVNAAWIDARVHP